MVQEQVRNNVAGFRTSGRSPWTHYIPTALGAFIASSVVYAPPAPWLHHGMSPLTEKLRLYLG